MPNQQKDQKQSVPSIKENWKAETDAHSLVSRHLADPNHVITDEELRSVRVGMPAAADAPTQKFLRQKEEKTADVKSGNEHDITPGPQKMTSWDVINP